MDTIYNANGCFYRALDDEPVFVLLARDPSAAEAVRWWVTLRQALIGSGEKPLEDHEKLAEALSTAARMVAWRSDATDPTKWGPGVKRWQVEEAPQRELVETGYVDKLRGRLRVDMDQFMFYCQQHVNKGTADGDSKANVNYEHACEIASLLGIDKPEFPKASVKKALPTGGKQLPYDDWAAWRRDAMPLGNRFLLGVYEGVLCLSENGRRGEGEESWSGLYPVQRSLQCDMLQCAYEDWRNGRQHKAETLKAMLPHHARLTQLIGDVARIHLDLEEFDGDRRGIAHALGEAEEALVNFVRENAKDLEKPRDDKGEVTLSLKVDAAPALEGLGRAALLALITKIAVGLRQITSDYIPVVNGTTWPDTRKRQMLQFADRINGYAAELEAADIPQPYDRERIEQAVVTAMREQPDIYREIMETPPHFAAGEQYDPERYRKGHTERTVGKHPALAAPYGTQPAESDTVDVTDVPDLPPHRFTMFTKARGWAYGRGLEINPSHIPDMLDKMAEDGWHLQCVFGGVVPDKVGMLFKRGTPTNWPDAPLPDYIESPNSLPQFLGKFEEWSLWVSPDMPPGVRACLLRVLSEEPCGAGGMGRGLEP